MVDTVPPLSLDHRSLQFNLGKLKPLSYSQLLKEICVFVFHGVPWRGSLFWTVDNRDARKSNHGSLVAWVDEAVLYLSKEHGKPVSCSISTLPFVICVVIYDHVPTMLHASYAQAKPTDASLSLNVGQCLTRKQRQAFVQTTLLSQIAG